MLKRFVVAAVVCAIVLAGRSSWGITLCDSFNIQYDFQIFQRELLHGTASNLPCNGGSAPLVGSYTVTPDGNIFFMIFVDQDPLFASCCEGFDIIGTWSLGSGRGNWYESRETNTCNNTGEFTLGRCGAVPPVSRPADFLFPGLKF